MEKNQTVKLNIENVGMNGEGVARPDGEVVFVKNALPGETCFAKILCAKKKFCYAAATVSRRLSGLRPPVPHSESAEGAPCSTYPTSISLR